VTLVKGIAAAALGAVMVIGCGLSDPPAQAAYIVTLAQQGTSVVATGSGTIDTAGLNFLRSAAQQANIGPIFGIIVTGPASAQFIDIYTGFSGPTSFGSGGQTFASTGSGDTVGIVEALGQLDVPRGLRL
jgi:hypothetical protein